jgi:HAD superfamily hydrolase (TIGR01457 family)
VTALPAPLRDGLRTAPAEVFDVALTDLDGVIYRGRRAVAYAAESIGAARRDGMRFAFVTNNALRPPSEVAEHLTELDVAAQVADVVTSAQAAAHLLADRLPPGAAVLVCGGAGLVQAVTEAGLCPVPSADDGPQAVVCGYDPTLDYPRLAEAALAVRAGALWVASNLDATVPTERGLLPGNGALVSVIATATGARPLEAGKPERALHEESIARSGAQHPLIVGDRLDTDIQAGCRWGTASLLVLTGVADAADLLAADEMHRPTYLSADLRGLLHPHPAVRRDRDGWLCGRWRATATEGVLRFTDAGTGSATGDDRAPEGPPTAGLPTPDGLDALRAGAVAAWEAADDGVAVGEIEAPPIGSGLEAGALRR